jgi:hypothetical protein
LRVLWALGVEEKIFYRFISDFYEYFYRKARRDCAEGAEKKLQKDFLLNINAT